MKTFIKAVAISALALLAACSSTPQASTDGVEEMAALAGSDGNLEATLEVVSVGSSAVSGQMKDQIELEGFRVTHKGKPINGFSFGAQPTGQVSAALAKGDRVKVRGRVSKIKGVPVFVGVLRPDSTQAAAITQPTPVVLVAGDKTLPAPTSNTITLQDVLVSSYCSTLRDMEILILRTNDGKPFASAIFKSPTGIKFDGVEGEDAECRVTLNLQGSVVQTPAGPVGQVSGQIKIGQRQPIAVRGVLSIFEVSDVPTDR